MPQPFTFLRLWFGLLLSSLLALSAHHAHADAYAEVSALIEAGNTSAALTQVQSHLAQNPRDVQMRFLQGSAQARAQDLDAAIATFTQLTQEFPELPEPYNNLAVIYAHQGQLEEARNALLNAIRNNPEYPVAHENLGDIYLRMAHQAYNQSVKLQGAQPALQKKLESLHPLLTTQP